MGEILTSLFSLSVLLYNARNFVDEERIFIIHTLLIA